MAITLTQLTAFLAVVRNGSITGAASELQVKQPSVSASLAALSKELGVELTRPVGRSVRPSAAGEAFAPYAADVIGLLDQGARAAREAAGAAPGELRVAAVTTAGESLVPSLLRAFAAVEPRVALNLEVGPRALVCARVLAHEADVAIVGLPVEDERVVTRSFAEEETVVVTAPDDPVAREPSVPARALATRPWLLREEGSELRTLAERFLAERGLAPPTRTLASNEAIRSAVRSGLGVALQPASAAGREVRAGGLGAVRLLEGAPVLRWWVVHSAIGPVREPVERFLDLLERRGADGAGPAARRGDPHGAPAALATVPG